MLPLLQRARKAAFLMTNPCEIILVRHGETAWNKEGRLQGQQEPGPPLDGLGTEQAAMVCMCVCISARGNCVCEKPAEA